MLILSFVGKKLRNHLETQRKLIIHQWSVGESTLIAGVVNIPGASLKSSHMRQHKLPGISYTIVKYQWQLWGKLGVMKGMAKVSIQNMVLYVMQSILQYT